MRLIVCLLIILWLSTGCTTQSSEPMASPTAAAQPALTLTLTVYILDDIDGVVSSQRTEQEVRDILTQVNKIWEPANILIELEQIKRIEIPAKLFAVIMQGDFDQFYQAAAAQTVDISHDSLMTGFYINELFANGIAPSGRYAFFVTDNPTVSAERVTAHEIGHILELHHVLDDEQRLMYSGTAGITLTAEEITVARYVAQGLLNRVR